MINEGIEKARINLVGNIMIDSLLNNYQRIESSFDEVRSKLGLEKEFFVVTLHRDENLDKEILDEIFSGLLSFSNEYQILLPAHPRLKEFIHANSIDTGKILLIDSLPYISFLSLVLNSKLCLTDSGGLQEETTILGVPCLTLREETERPITVDLGTNRVIGTKKEDIIDSVKLVLEAGESKKVEVPLWDGKTSERIIDVIKEKYIKWVILNII